MCKKREEECPLLRVETCTITGQSTSLGTAGHVDGFACHMLGAGVREPRRWRSPVAKLPSRCQLCLERAKWGASEGTKNPQCPRDMTPMDETFDPEKDWNELHKDMESEEDP